MNRQSLDPEIMRLPPVKDLVEEVTAQTNAWGWILKDPRFPELQYFVPYPMVSHGPPPTHPQPSVVGMPQIPNRALPPLTTSPTPLFYYPVPLEQMTPDSTRVTTLPPIHRPHSQPSGSHVLISTSSSINKTRTSGPQAAASSSSPVSDNPASTSPCPQSLDQTPGTPPLDCPQESPPAEQRSPTPAPARSHSRPRSHSYTTRPSRHTTTIPGRAPTIRIVQFLDVTAHTAKCDDCDRRNREGMIRCCICGWQCCRNCQNSRGGSRTHRSFQSVHVASQAEADQAARSDAAHALVRMNGKSAASGSSRPRRHRRGRSLSPGRSLDSDDTISHPSLTEDSAEPELGSFGVRERRNPPRFARPEGFAE